MMLHHPEVYDAALLLVQKRMHKQAQAETGVNTLLSASTENHKMRIIS